MRRFPALLVTILLCLITTNLWIAAKPAFNIIWESPLRSLSQLLGLLGIVLMSFTIILSTKIKLIDKIMEGLDKAYNIHQIAGSAAFIFLLNHPILLAIQALPQAKLAIIYLLPSSSIANNFGVAGLYLMVLAFICMFFVKLPYDKWKLTHRFLGPAFLLGSLHALLIGSDISKFFPLKIWVGFFIVTGIISATYSFFYRRLGPRFFYKITGIERAADVITIHLQPQGASAMTYNPGQFVYAEFKNKKIGNELHPFSIVSSPQEENLQISAKIVGDYSLKLFHYLQEGETGVVYGPYGHFAKNLAGLGNCLWIAGGIGVTPFLSMLSAEADNCSERSIHFYYIHSEKEEGVFLGQIYNFLRRAPHVTFIDWCTKDKNRLTADAVKDYLDIRSIDAIFLCGPLSMMEGFKKQFLDRGIPEKKIFYENFSLIS